MPGWGVRSRSRSPTDAASRPRRKWHARTWRAGGQIPSPHPRAPSASSGAQRSSRGCSVSRTKRTRAGWRSAVARAARRKGRYSDREALSDLGMPGSSLPGPTPRSICLARRSGGRDGEIDLLNQEFHALLDIHIGQIDGQHLPVRASIRRILRSGRILFKLNLCGLRTRQQQEDLIRTAYHEAPGGACRGNANDEETPAFARSRRPVFVATSAEATSMTETSSLSHPTGIAKGATGLSNCQRIYKFHPTLGRYLGRFQLTADATFSGGGPTEPMMPITHSFCFSHEHACGGTLQDSHNCKRKRLCFWGSQYFYSR